MTTDATQDWIELIELIEYVLPYVPQVPTATAESCIRMAAREFYNDSGVWEYRLPEATVQEDVCDYLLTPPLNTYIERVDRLEFENDYDTIGYYGGYHNFRHRYYGHRTTSYTNRLDNNEMHFEFRPPRTLHFNVTPETGKCFYPWVQLNLSMKAEEIPCDHMNRYGRLLQDGALWLLYNQMGTPWHSPNQAEYHRQLFRNAIVGARAESNRRHRKANMRVAPQPFI